MKVLVTGARGQLGTALCRLAPAGTELVALESGQLDVGDEAQVEREVQRVEPDLLINAAGYTHVDRAETDREAAFRVNADGVRFLADAVAVRGGRMIHVSTDFVFAGDRPVPYEPDATTSPLNVYGDSKRAGEEAVLKILGPAAVVVRTSWLYAAEGRNFVKTILGLLASRESIRVVVDQVGSPTWVSSLAGAIWDISRMPGIHGIQHWSDEGIASWYDFAVAIQEEALARRLLSTAVPIRAIPACEYPTPARRPHYSVLDKRRTSVLLGYAPPHWRQSLRSMLDELVGRPA